jgi:hypothetical protein
MEIPMRRSIPVLLLAVAASLSACETPTLGELAVSCPAVAILAQASEITKVRPGAAPPTEEDIILTAEMLPVTVSCDYDLGDPDVTVDVSIPIVVRPGPVDNGPQSLTYFAAVIGPEGNMISKRLFTRNLAAGGMAMGTYTETVTGTTIGLPQNLQPYDYQVLVGFQLTAGEYVLNQADPLYRP